MERPFRMLTPFHIYLAPRRAGRSLMGRSIAWAVAVHLLSLLAGAVLLALIFLALQSGAILPADSHGYILSLCRDVAAALLDMAAGRLGGVQDMVALATLLAIGEICYWCFAIPVLGA